MIHNLKMLPEKRPSLPQQGSPTTCSKTQQRCENMRVSERAQQTSFESLAVENEVRDSERGWHTELPDVSFTNSRFREKSSVKSEDLTRVQDCMCGCGCGWGGVYTQ